MIQPIKPSEIPPRSGRVNKVVEEDVKDFMDSSSLAGRVRFPEGQSAKSAYASYHKVISRHNYQVEVMIRGNEVFLRKKTALGAGTPKGGKGK